MARLHDLTGSWRPDAQETLLVQAALRTDPVAARRAWDAWRAGGGTFDGLHGGTSWVATRVCDRFDEPVARRLKVVRRHAWIANATLRRALVDVLAVLERAAIPSMLLKGAALAHTVYGDWSLRPMGDADVLVPTEAIDAALAALAAAGWEPVDPFGGCAFPREWPGFRYLYQAVLVERGRAPPRVDLHWHALGAMATAGSDDAFWARAQPTSLDGVATRVPCPTDLLLQVIVHGARHEEPLHLQWASDAVALLAGPIDWDRLVGLARERRVRLQVADALAWLRETVDVEVADPVVAALRDGPPTHAERTYQAIVDSHPATRRAWADAPGRARVVARLWRRYRLHEAFTTGPRALTPLGRAQDFARFCRYHLRLDHPGGIRSVLDLALHR